jgi:hypothetical protein
MIHLFQPKLPIRFQGNELILKGNSLLDPTSKIFYQSSVDPSKSEICFPRFGPVIAIEDEYLLLFSACEHSCGGSLHDHKVEILKGKTLVSTLYGHFTNQAIFQSADSNPKLSSLILLRFINGIYTYNSIPNSGNPSIELCLISLPSGGISNRWIVDIPEKLKSKYNHTNIVYMDAELYQSKKKIMIRSKPMTRTDAADFEIAIPYT